MTAMSNGDNASKSVEVPITIMIPDSTDSADYIKSLRYMLALEKTFIKNTYSILNVQNITLQLLTPFVASAQDEKNIFKNKIASGIVVTMSYS